MTSFRHLLRPEADGARIARAVLLASTTAAILFAGVPRSRAEAPEAAEPGRGEPGTALDDELLVACGEGALRALVVQRAGRAAMDAADFLRGRAVPTGTRLS